MRDCAFCRIARNEVKPAIVYEDEFIVAFLDRTPIRRGHTQIIPRSHYGTFDELPADLALRIVTLGQQLARRMKTLYAVSGVAFVFTGGDVAHAHAHVIPMVEPTDVTSTQYMLEPKPELSSKHLRTDIQTLRKVAAELRG